MDELVHPPALELVERDPFELEILVAEHARDARPHVFRPLFDGGIGIRMQLQVDAPDVVRLLVQQRGAAGVERRVEPEPAFGRECRRHLDVGDQELVLEHFPREFRAHHLPQRRARAVAGDDEIGLDPVRTIRRLDRQRDMVVALLQRGHLVAPAQIDRGQFLHPIHQIAFGIELLQVDEGGPLVSRFRQQVELIELRGRRERSCRRSRPRPCRPCAGRCRAGPKIPASVSRSRSRASPRRSGRHRRAARRTWPRCARSIASDSPTGPAPTTTTGCSQRRALPILIGVTAVAELDFGLLRHGLNIALAKGARPAKIVASATI